MSQFRTVLWMAATLVCLPHSTKADEALFEIFASCSGRLSALVEHSWLVGNGESERLERIRDDLISVSETMVLDRDDAVRAMSFRLDAKVAQARLLTHATFNADASIAAWSERRANTLLADCVALVSHVPRPVAHLGRSYDSVN